MKLNLQYKIVLAFTVIILSGTFLMVGIINYTTRSGYETFARQNDISYNRELAYTLESYYSFQNSWDGVEDILRRPVPKRNNMMQNRRQEREAPNMMNPPILLTDTRGKTIYSTIPKNRFKTIKNGTGEPITYENKIIAYVYTGTMITNGLSEKEDKFLNKTTSVIVLVSIFILTISILFANYFSKKLTNPLTALSNGVSDIEAGNFRSRVNVSGDDEISILSNSFNNMAKTLENNDIWRKQIIADSAHELRTPVALIQGNLEMIIDGVYKPEMVHLENIYQETLVLSRLVKELQQLSSSDSGAMTLNRSKFNINDLFENSMDIFKPEAIKKDIELKYINANSPITIDADLDKLKQVLTNILTNAFRHTPEGGKIEISSKSLNGNVDIKISDSGCGIKPEDLEKIFERFYRTDSARNRKHGGSGLGLAISRGIIKAHKGSIYANSNYGAGTIIHIILPT
ncbi:MAG: ATP-binding protein [Spirochaetaceae bacterium]